MRRVTSVHLGSWWWSCFLAGSIWCGGFLAWSADMLRGPIRGGFSVAEADRETGQRQFHLRGESATPVSADEWAIEGARLEIYGADGATNLVFTPTRCIYHQKAQRVTSPDELRVVSGDGQMAIQGIGFGLDLASRRLVISNAVHAVLRKDVVRAEPPSGAVTGSTEVIEIRSDHLEFEGEEALFLGRVRVDDAQGWMTCNRLRVDLELASRRVEMILAEEEVALESNEIRAWAGRVTYDPSMERLELEGDPEWQFEGRSGRAEFVMLDRLEQRVEALGQVEMEIAARAFLPESVWPAALRPDFEQEGQEPRIVRVRSDTFSFGPDPVRTNGHRATFRGQVEVTEQALRLECGQLIVETDEPGQQARRAVASERVVFERATDRITCAQVVYDALAGRMTLEGGATWRTEEREGRADTLVLDLAKGRYRAVGNVLMRLAGEGFGAALGWVDPEPERASPPDVAEAASQPRETRWIEIECDWFEYQGAPEAVGLETAVYEGNVRVREGEQFLMTSALLTVAMDVDEGTVEEMVAAGDVELRMVEADGYRLARGDRAMYAANRGTVELTGIEGVEFFIVTGEGVSRGVGRRAVYDRTTELLELDGRPVITTPEGELTGDRVRLDRVRGTLSAAGSWRIRLPMGTVRMPELPAP
jgi:lipopolysaccharide export system protein LptA